MHRSGITVPVGDIMAGTKMPVINPPEFGSYCRKLPDDVVSELRSASTNLWLFAYIPSQLSTHLTVTRTGVESGSETVVKLVEECINTEAVVKDVKITIEPGMYVKVSSSEWHTLELYFGRECEVYYFTGTALIGGKRVPFRSSELIYPRVHVMVGLPKTLTSVKLCRNVKVPDQLCLTSSEYKHLWGDVANALRDVAVMIKNTFDGRCCTVRVSLLIMYP